MTVILLHQYLLKWFVLHIPKSAIKLPEDF